METKPPVDSVFYAAHFPVTRAGGLRPKAGLVVALAPAEVGVVDVCRIGGP